MKIYLLALAVGISAGCVAQPKPKTQHRPAKPSLINEDRAPVTEAEVAASFWKAERILGHALHLSSLPKSSIPAKPRAATRPELIAELYRLYKLCEPQFKITPAAVRFDKSALKPAGSTNNAKLTRLVEMGCVARLGPIATGPKETLTVLQFGDALGFFLARISEMTNTPSSQWTPYLHD